MPDNQLPRGYQPQKSTPRQMAQRYGFPIDKYDGKGQKVAILIFGSAITAEEIEADLKKFGINDDNITIKMVDDQVNPDPGVQSPVEVHLDAETIGSICPEAEITIYYSRTNQTPYTTFFDPAIADGNKVISISFGAPEQNGDQNIDVFHKAAAAGITVCIASGDDGSRDRLNNGKANADFPASTPYALACGGTMIDGAGQEVVWNLEAEGGGAGGGGVSEVFPVPAWQEKDAADIKNANTGGSGRVTPDVAALAAPGDWIIELDDGKRQEVLGGTSAVAPLMAAFFTLVNQARADAGKQPLGFVNDKLYGLSPRDTYFNDITLGNNKPTPDYPGYDAAVGLDACSGLGSPKGDALFQALVDMD